MPLLGMLAAGAATGLRDASNMDVRAQNELELDQRREQIREQFYNRKYNQARADAVKDGIAKAQQEAAKRKEDREFKVADDKSEKEFKLQLETFKQGEATKRANAKINAKPLLKEEGDNKFGKMSSPAGKAATDLMRLGLAEDPATAYQMAVRLDIVKAAQQNPLTKIDDNALLGSVQRLTQGLFPGNPSAPQNQASSDMVRTFNPKTRKFE